MDENRIGGTARSLGGKVQEEFGRTVGDTKTQAEGIGNQVKGAAQDLYGQARERASQATDAIAEGAAGIGQTASSFERTLRKTIETQPYTAAIVALGLGWLLGRMHRPV